MNAGRWLTLEQAQTLGRALGGALLRAGQSIAVRRGAAAGRSAAGRRGFCIALYGGMGVGKTTFARALAQGLGIEGVTSPTFAILHEYAGPVLPLYHFDAYRLTGSGELYDIGFEEYLERNGVVIIEWPEIVADALPSERLDITIAGSGEAPRVIGITPHGELYKETLRLMNEGLPC